MTVLNSSTARRLNKLRQTADIWEGDRRSLDFLGTSEGGDWIVWADHSHVVRAMDMVPAREGPEVLVRTLIAAMESPQRPAQPARPQGILVCDRELQFFLRGALQDLNIQVNYAPHLPLVEEICQELQAMMAAGPPSLPTAYDQSLVKAAATLWKDAPWRSLGDHQILEVTLEGGEIGPLLVSVLGFLGAEYGLLFYRTEASMREFRQQMTTTAVSPEEMETIFLHQDCLFLNFDALDDVGPVRSWTGNLEQDEVEPVFGSIHPLEGMRAFLDEDEATTLTVALEALHRFWQRHGHKLEADQFPSVSGRYRISSPQTSDAIAVQVKTRPNLAAELWSLGFSEDDLLDEESLPNAPILRQDLIPENAFFSLGMMPWNIVEVLRLSAQHYQPGQVTTAGDGFPILMVQTTRPKAKAMIEELKAAGGVTGLVFNPGESPFEDEQYDLGILKTDDQQLHLFGEYSNDEPIHQRAKQKWNQRCKKTKGWCGLVIAKGVTGKSRGQPTINDFVALFEVRSLSAADLDLGTLQLMPQFLS